MAVLILLFAGGEDQKKEVKDKESKKDLELILKLKTLERELAASKQVSLRTRFRVDVIIKLRSRSR